MLQKGPTFNHVLVNNVARLPKSLNLKFEKMKIRKFFANSMHMLLAKSNLRQQHCKAVGKEGSSATAW
jgi:hypothetical protein